ncbi:DUF1330 domain-containing protein [Novosphingobium colocasiae]|uniref:DUF1330 domain-containing protein n=1 Tax=Novosphingobium colocasiae TaxID=1256513 RepID=UPI0035ADD5AF
MPATVAMVPELIDSVAAAAPAGEPILMLNLLRFRAQADYAADAGVSPCTGREAYYDRYAPVASRLIFAQGARIHAYGTALGNLIAPADEVWDELLLVEYPDACTFQALFHNPEYQAVVFHRTAALADSRLTPFLASSAGL